VTQTVTAPDYQMVVSDVKSAHSLRKAGVPAKVVSERLGHASVAFTMQVYQHVLPGMQADAAATFGEMVFGH
jgi:integrase